MLFTLYSAKRWGVLSYNLKVYIQKLKADGKEIYANFENMILITV